MREKQHDNYSATRTIWKLQHDKGYVRGATQKVYHKKSNKRTKSKKNNNVRKMKMHEKR